MNGGYMFVYLRTNDSDIPRIPVSIHRLVAWEFCDGHDEDHDTVNHLDSIRTHNTVANLKWVSDSENTIHGFEDGNINRYGENNHTNKYDLSIVKEIDDMIKNGYRDIDIMKHFGYEKTRDNISLRGLIYDIRHKRRWQHSI